MLMRIFVILFSTAFACIIVAMALEGAHNSLSIFKIAHVIILFGMIMSFPSMVYGYLRGSIDWENGVRTYRPYLKTALIASITNGAVWGLVLGVPFMEDGPWLFTLILIAFGLGGAVASAVAFALMQSLERGAGKPPDSIV
ncbi:MAG TPA: hypothetical protein VFS88_02400 [Micavibrio sp.]|nr:hypothetical protein [Micavibrio sp.]